MKTKKIIMFFTVILLLNLNISAQAAYTVLHNFAGGTNDGAGPLSSLLRSGSMLYGMTHDGGSNNNGTIFKMNTDGTGFQVLHSFNGGSGDGYRPHGSLILSGSTLYGMTEQGGAGNYGVVFRINTDGTNFQLLHSFIGSDGKYPLRSLLQSGATLYGMTNSGGSSNLGNIFKVNTDGSASQVLHNFAGSNGASPTESLIQSGSILYGMTRDGGISNSGTIFKINANGTGFQLLHSFNGSNGAGPHGTPLQSGSILYGMAAMGGSSDLGTLFRINTDGNNFSVLRSFTGGIADGSFPIDTPVQAGSMLYGITINGGSSNLGTIFKFNTNDANFQLLHSFNDAGGSIPYGSLVMSGLKLYGMTSAGGSNNKGVIFSIDIPVSNCSNVIANGFGLESDLNNDCYVNFKDLDVFADYWLNTNCGSTNNCQGADFVPTDGKVDFLDFGDFADQWTQCNNPTDSNCTSNW